MDARLWNPRMRWSSKSMVLVFVETRMRATSAWAVVDVIEDEVAPLVVGRDPHYVEQFWQDVRVTTDLSLHRGVVSAALSAVDMALWDLLAKSLNIPLHHLPRRACGDVAIPGQAIVNARSPIPVCGNDTKFGSAKFRELITHRAVVFVKSDLAICGGRSEGRRIASLASAFYMPCNDARGIDSRSSRRHASFRRGHRQL